jgi:hypothetical protein
MAAVTFRIRTLLYCRDKSVRREKTRTSLVVWGGGGVHHNLH